MADSLARQIYAEKISNELVEKYNLEKEAFQRGRKNSRENIVFAISGKWGEGKTELLNLLEKPLKKNGFSIIRFNPWKYSQEDITLKRAFLGIVRKQLKSNVDLSDLYFDRTRTIFNWQNIPWKKIFKKILITFAIIIVLPPMIVGFGYGWWTTLLLDTFSNVYKSVSALIIALTTFLLIPLIIKTVTLDKRSAKVSTAEEFEEKFDQLLKNKEKIAIFIDDLDRCNSKTVKVILDSLKTFFQHPECTFVITGDHTVIERYAANELELPAGSSEGKKIQEGRRFLKKLFDVYWRLPLPTPYQFGIFIEDEIKHSKINFKKEVQELNFKTFLLSDELFERNPRHVKRFITKVRFALESVLLQIGEIEKLEKENKANNGIEESKKSLNDIYDNPDLLSKILLIEEFFYPIYEQLVLHPEELLNQEKTIRNGGDVATLTLDKKTVLSILEDNQVNAESYISLLNASPKFTDDDNSTLHEVADYFLLSGSTGLPSALGPDESKFIEYLKSGKLVSKLGSILESGTTERKQANAKRALELFDSSLEEEKINIISESLKLCSKIDIWSSNLNAWKDKLFTLPENRQSEIMKLFYEALLKKDPSLIKPVYADKPNFSSLLWDMLTKIEIKNLHQNANAVLKDIAIISLNEQTFNLTAANTYVNYFPENRIDDSIRQTLVSPDICKKYIDQLNQLNLGGSVLFQIAKTQLGSLLTDISNIDWAIQNKEFLKTLNIFGQTKIEIIKSSNNIDHIRTVVHKNIEMELDEQDKLIVSDNLLKNIGKSSIELLDDTTIQNFLNKSKKIILFGILTGIFLNNREDQTKRLKTSKSLLQSNNLWVGFSKDDIYDSLRKINSKKLNKNKDISDSKNNLLISWGYEEAKKDTDEKDTQDVGK